MCMEYKLVAIAFHLSIVVSAHRHAAMTARAETEAAETAKVVKSVKSAKAKAKRVAKASAVKQEARGKTGNCVAV